MIRRQTAVSSIFGRTPIQMMGGTMPRWAPRSGTSGAIYPSSRSMISLGPSGPGGGGFGGGFGIPQSPFPDIGGGTWWGDIVNTGVDWIWNQFNPSGGPTSGSTSGEGTGGCPTGYEFNPGSGQCEKVGVSGTIQRALPYGQTGVMNQGTAVMGAFGTPAMQPNIVGQVANSRGEVNPIFRCNPGMVLGKDNLCYAKSAISKKDRKWKPAAKPPMSASDAKALRRIGTLQRKVKGLAKNAGLSCRKR